jgi:3'-phosphoadenosine 5'-phosphosulfate sulfotransferase (PAPS reductase)/FAD synthetase
MISERRIAWFSCGAASAVATKIAIEDYPETIVAYCETGSEHEDNIRFIAECESWYCKKIERLSSDKFDSTWDVWLKKRYLAGTQGAPCTVELKVVPRLRFQHPNDIHVFGYTSDGSDAHRAERLRKNFPELFISTPLIDRGISKSACLALLQRRNIKIPAMYELGFANNNCIPCVKATSPAYWALVRKHFPEQFTRLAGLSRHLNVRLCQAQNRQRIFIDEIPIDQPTRDAIAPSCDFLCHLVEQEYLDG